MNSKTREEDEPMNAAGFLLLGSDVLLKEILWLIEKNGRPLSTLFFDSVLLCDLTRLVHCPHSALTVHRNSGVIVFFGCSHPQMKPMLEEAGALRTDGHNGFDMRLGPEVFMEEPEAAARIVNSPPRWIDVTRNPLETVPQVAFTQ